MPTYEYRCSKCGRVFERFQGVKDAVLRDCLDGKCGGVGTMKRLVSGGSGVIFRGSGFYVNDYGKGSR